MAGRPTIDSLSSNRCRLPIYHLTYLPPDHLTHLPPYLAYELAALHAGHVAQALLGRIDATMNDRGPIERLAWLEGQLDGLRGRGGSIIERLEALEYAAYEQGLL